MRTFTLATILAILMVVFAPSLPLMLADSFGNAGAATLALVRGNTAFSDFKTAEYARLEKLTQKWRDHERKQRCLKDAAEFDRFASSNLGAQPHTECD